MDRRRTVLLAVAAVVLAVGAEVPVPTVKAVCGLLLCVALAVCSAEAVTAIGPASAPQRATAAALGPVAALMIVGLVLSVTDIGIRPDSIGPALAVVVLIGCAVLLRRGAPGGATAPSQRPGLRLGLLVPGVLVLTGAVVLSVVSYLDWQSGFRFTSLSARFRDARSVSIEITNHDGRAKSYHLLATAGPVLLDRTIAVPDGQLRTLTVRTSSPAAVTVRLYDAGPGGRQLRSVTVRRSSVTGGR